MKFYKILFLFIFASCAPIEKTTNIHFKESFTNSGFALIYDDKFFENKKINKKLDNRSYEVFQRNLPKVRGNFGNALKYHPHNGSKTEGKRKRGGSKQ